MEKGYKFRIYPDEEQKILIGKTCGCVRYVYNHYLSKKINLYKEEKKTLSLNDCNKDMTVLKQEEDKNWLKEVDKFALYYSLKHLDKAYKNFFREQKKGNTEQGFPKFKSKHRSRKKYKTAYTNGNIEVGKNYIKLPKLGKVKARLHRKTEGIIVNATVEHSPSNKYYVSICCINVIADKSKLINCSINLGFRTCSLLTGCHEIYFKDIYLKIIPEKFPSSEKVTGMDFGLKDLITDSNGNKYENKKCYRKLETNLAVEQKKLSRKEPGSKRYIKQRIKVAKIHEKIKNKRTDDLQKLSTRLINENQVICMEDLSVRNMVKNRKLSKSISDAGWYSLKLMLMYKALWYGREIVIINRFFPSSQLCHKCGYRNEDLSLSERVWECPQCKSILDRDINAAINVREEGLNILRGRNCPMEEPIELPQ